MMLQLRKRKGFEAEDVLDQSAADSEGAPCSMSPRQQRINTGDRPGHGFAGNGLQMVQWEDAHGVHASPAVTWSACCPWHALAADKPNSQGSMLTSRYCGARAGCGRHARGVPASGQARKTALDVHDRIVGEALSLLPHGLVAEKRRLLQGRMVLGPGRP